MKTRRCTVTAAVVMFLLPPPTASPQDARRTFTVGTAAAERGQKALGVLNVPQGLDAGYDIPVASTSLPSRTGCFIPRWIAIGR